MNRRRGARNISAVLGGAFTRAKDLGARAAAKLRWPGRKNRRKLGIRPPERATAPEGEETHASTPSRTLGAIGTFLLWALPVVAAATAFAIPLLGVRAYEYVMQSGYFHVREVIIDQTSTRSTMAPDRPHRPHLSREEVLATAGIGAGTHLLEADLEAMTQRLMAHPWIRWARIEKELPDVLIVHVVEHVPSAHLAPHLPATGLPTAGEAVPQLLLVDELGEVFTESPPGLALELPVITGVGTDRLAPLDPALSQELIAGLNVLRLWASQGLARRYPVGELRLLPGGAYGLVLEVRDQSGGRMGVTEITLGRGPFREKLLRVEFILEHLHAQGRVAEYILLDMVDDLDPRAVEVAGAQVVVKADLKVDPVEALDALVRREATLPQTRRAPARPRTNTPQVLPELEEPPTQTNPHAEDTDAPSEAAPLSGGRPADDLGQE